MHFDKACAASDGSKERVPASDAETPGVELTVSVGWLPNLSVSMWMSSSRWTRRPLKPLNKQLVRSLLLSRCLLIQWGQDWSRVLDTLVAIPLACLSLPVKQ